MSQNKNIKILLVTHKPFKIPKGKYFVPIHAGRKIAEDINKDGKIDSDDYNWLLENTIGDDSGDNISDKNRYYSECSALYWAWKNYDKLGDPEYIGLMHYRRHFVFNNAYYEGKISDNWHRGLSYISENFIDDDYIKNIGLIDENIQSACSAYDLILAKDANLNLLHNGSTVRENYKNSILGSNVRDFDLMVDIIKKYFPQYISGLSNINGSKKYLYQMFIMKKELFFEYCEFLFKILSKIERQVNFSEYTTNGKRTLGYLAEVVFSIFVWSKEETAQLHILKLGVAYVDFPYEESELQKIINAGCPSYIEYIISKLHVFFSSGVEKQKNIEKSKSLRFKRSLWKKLKCLKAKHFR